LKSPTYFNQLTGKLAGTTRTRISRKNLETVTINVPSFQIQSEVVDILDHVESVITNRKKELCAFDNLIKARFVEMFGVPYINPKGQMMTIQKAVEAGLIEKPFDGNHGEKHPKASEYVEKGIPFLMANNISERKITCLPAFLFVLEAFQEGFQAFKIFRLGDGVMGKHCLQHFLLSGKEIGVGVDSVLPGFGFRNDIHAALSAFIAGSEVDGADGSGRLPLASFFSHILR
jgi:hypothetical protein